MLLLVAGFSSPGQATQTAILAWDASSDPTVVGHNVYFGGSSGHYTNVTAAVDGATSVPISGLVAGATYYFAGTAFDALGVESDLSEEVSYTVPDVFAGLQISAAASGRFQLVGAGLVGHTYEIQQTLDLVDWITMDTRTVGSSGSFEFTDWNASLYAAQFYRARDTQP